MRILSISFLLLFLSVKASAEYRVFRLLITSRTPAVATTEEITPPVPPSSGHEVISTLDPDQYRGYYSVRDDQVVTYTQTWMCHGNTGNFKEVCPPPAPQASSTAP